MMPLMRSMCQVLFKKKRLQCMTKTVNLHVWVTQVLYGQFADKPTRRQTNVPTNQIADRRTR